MKIVKYSYNEKMYAIRTNNDGMPYYKDFVLFMDCLEYTGADGWKWGGKWDIMDVI